ncbi:hypothetical protein ColLi_10914 [Colletotrichum liriopes]|uniref:Uncharacterized protein n=1 Tax=Colletotrichum liriopes TaxID=708192 RepID=A0AA37LXV9_9PEZI|nr:hypothetical protein ColLi_10914 [Colletotrichum liriopes]
MDRLLADGYDIKTADRNPFLLMNKLKTIIPKISEDDVAELVRELCNLKRKNFSDTHKYLQRGQYPIRRIDELVLSWHQKAMFILLNGCQQEHPALYRRSNHSSCHRGS